MSIQRLVLIVCQSSDAGKHTGFYRGFINLMENFEVLLELVVLSASVVVEQKLYGMTDMEAWGPLIAILASWNRETCAPLPLHLLNRE